MLYDEDYRRVPSLWGSNPGKFVRDWIVRAQNDGIDFQNLRVLDAGAGEGKNSVPPALLGAQVSAVDSPRIALQRFENQPDWNVAARRVDLHEADIRTFDVGTDCYDLVIAYGSYIAYQILLNNEM
jgi:predicted RNA methylase